MTTKPISIPILWLVLAIIIPFACSVHQGNGNLFESPRPVCIDWATLPLGEYEINNNVWGKGRINNYSQCIFKGVRSKPGTYVNMGWSWNWPKGASGVKSYPSILYGRKPWNGYSTTPHLPQEIKQLRNLNVSYSIDTTSSGAVNLLLESWITSTPKAEPKERIGELAIQLYQKHWPGQAGKLIDDAVVIAGTNFDFYLDPEIHVPGDSHTWAYYGFVHKGEPLLHAKLDMMDFARYLIRQGYLDEESYLTSVELGNEVDHGKGTTILKHFSVDAAPKS